MSYDKELGYLRKELKKSRAKFNEAVEEGRERYAEIWHDDILDKKHQIHVYEQAAKADEYEDNLNEVKKQLKIKIRHAKRDGDYSWAYAYSDVLNMIEDLI